MASFREPQIVLFTADLPRAAAFYERLGFRETFRTPAEGDPIHVDLVLDDYRIGLATVASTRGDHGVDADAVGQRAAVVLWTDDVPSALEDLVEAGATPHSGPLTWLGRLTIGWVLDPDGNPLQVVQRDH